MHQEQREFCERVKAKHLDLFLNVDMLDCGALDVNGTNRYLFTSDTRFLGVDIAHGPNVDEVSRIHELRYPDGHFDTVISTECLEHDIYWEESLKKMTALVRSGGLLLVTCATTGREEHGTARAHAGDSPFTSVQVGWRNYYRNLTEADVRQALDVDAVFSEYAFEVHHGHHDLYFYGIKR